MSRALKSRVSSPLGSWYNHFDVLVSNGSDSRIDLSSLVQMTGPEELGLSLP